jgi:hypothetical protein
MYRKKAFPMFVDRESSTYQYQLCQYTELENMHPHLVTTILSAVTSSVAHEVG